MNVVLRAGTGEMIIEASNREVLPAGILYLRPPTDHDWGPYHLILLRKLVADRYVLVVSYQQDFKDRCIDYPYLMMKELLRSVPEESLLPYILREVDCKPGN